MLTTKHKISIAKLAQSSISAVRTLFTKEQNTIVTRKGLRWNLDLREGIDFAIYLLGGFELETRKAFARIVQPGMTVIDIGANIGAHTLPLAAMLGDDGKLIAVEPTDWAFRKLKTNLALNSHIISRVTTVQAMLVGSSNEALPDEIFSSWPLTAETTDDLHPIHLGRPMSTQGAKTITLDDLLQQLDISRVDVIKLDVDGFELGVLQGAQGVISNNESIRIVMELAPSLFNRDDDEMGQIFRLLQSHGLVLTRLDNGASLPMT
ncbi:MAG: FkbM family methyltransferase, partial [Nitrososphaera sp.]